MGVAVFAADLCIYLSSLGLGFLVALGLPIRGISLTASEKVDKPLCYHARQARPCMVGNRFSTLRKSTNPFRTLGFAYLTQMWVEAALISHLDITDNVFPRLISLS